MPRVAWCVGEKLGWEVYSQDMLEYGAQNSALRLELGSNLSASAAAWVDERVHELTRESPLSRHPNINDLARLALTLASQGNVILLGRGAGFILPSRSTLHVRLVAPLPDRVAYMTQWLRLTEEEAAQQVHQPRSSPQRLLGDALPAQAERRARLRHRAEHEPPGGRALCRAGGRRRQGEDVRHRRYGLKPQAGFVRA